MDAKVFFVVNPVSAGKKTVKEWPSFEKQFKEKGLKFDWAFTDYPEHATSITREVLKSGYDLVVSVGGDGTLNEVLNGFFEMNNPINPKARLAVFSRGTGSDFIKSLGIKKGFGDFYSVLQRNNVQKFDVGRATFCKESGEEVNKLFLNIADVGLGAETTRLVNKTKKHLKGFFAFLVGAMLTIFKYQNKSITIEIDGQQVKSGTMNSVIIANAKYFGGGMYISPKSKADDGILDIIVIGDLSKLELIRNFHLIYKGKHLTHPKITTYQGKQIKVISEPVGLLELDGEQLGTAPAYFEIIPQAINLLV
ncbi:MAG: diacylglycerol kinase family protein [Lutisporaceae bacterium]